MIFFFNFFRKNFNVNIIHSIGKKLTKMSKICNLKEKKCELKKKDFC